MRLAQLLLVLCALSLGGATTVDTRSGAACSALAELEDEYIADLRGAASAEIHNIVDPGTSTQCASTAI